MFPTVPCPPPPTPTVRSVRMTALDHAQPLPGLQCRGHMRCRGQQVWYTHRENTQTLYSWALPWVWIYTGIYVPSQSAPGNWLARHHLHTRLHKCEDLGRRSQHAHPKTMQCPDHACLSSPTKAASRRLEVEEQRQVGASSQSSDACSPAPSSDEVSLLARGRSDIVCSNRLRDGNQGKVNSQSTKYLRAHERIHPFSTSVLGAWASCAHAQQAAPWTHTKTASVGAPNT